MPSTRAFQSCSVGAEARADDGPLETPVGCKAEQIGQLDAGPDQPEPRIGEPEQTKRDEPDPVRRHEHAERPGVEGGFEIGPEGGFHWAHCQLLIADC